MQESYWGYWLVILGVFITVVMMMIQSITTSNSQDYYQLKEITDEIYKRHGFRMVKTPRGEIFRWGFGF